MKGITNKIPLMVISLILAVFSVSPSVVRAESASFYLSPSSGTFFVGSTFDVSVFVNTEGSSINAVQVDLKFPPDKFQVVNPTTGKSFISVWADQPFFSNEDGLISFKGGVPSPGIKTSGGLVSTITFRAKAPGTAKIYFLDSSKVLLADGKGTDILKTTMVGEYYFIIPSPEGPKVTSPTHPSFTTWYRDNNPSFSWEREQGMSEFSYSLDQDSTGLPDNISEGSQTFKTFNGIDDGVWYFHIRAKKGDAWGKATHYPIRIDSTPPKTFEIDIKKTDDLTGSRFFAYFSTIDLLSGIDHYELSVVDATDPQAAANPFFVETVSPYKIPYQTRGKYMVLVKAYDKAGNYVQKENIFSIVSPFISFNEKGLTIGSLFLAWWLIYVFFGILLVLLGVATSFLIRRRNLAATLRREVKEAEKEIEDVRELEKKIRDTRILEEEAKKQAERLADRLKKEKEL